MRPSRVVTEARGYFVLKMHFYEGREAEAQAILIRLWECLTEDAIKQESGFEV